MFGKRKTKSELDLDFDDDSDVDDSSDNDNDYLDNNNNLTNDLDMQLDNLDDGFCGISPMEKHSDLLKGLTDFTKHIIKLYNNWLGIVWDEEQKKYMSNPALKPIMNVIGCNWNVSFIETYVRGNNILAHLNLDEHQSLIMDINRTLLLTYAKRYKEFGFNCYSDVIRVWNEVENASLLALSGAGGGKYSGFLGSGIVKYQGSFTEDGNAYNAGYGHNMGGMGNMPGMIGVPPQRKGLFGKMKTVLLGEKNR